MALNSSFETVNESICRSTDQCSEEMCDFTGSCPFVAIRMYNLTAMNCSYVLSNSTNRALLIGADADFTALNKSITTCENFVIYSSTICDMFGWPDVFWLKCLETLVLIPIKFLCMIIIIYESSAATSKIDIEF